MIPPIEDRILVGGAAAPNPTIQTGGPAGGVER
jgi:hypothetical protein